MKHLLLIYHQEEAWKNRTESERQQTYAEYRQLIDELKSKGKYLFGDQLQPAGTAQTVRVRDGKPMVTDGPFAETREQLGGYYIVEAKDLDEAIGIAERVPPVRYGTVEIRPVMEIPGLPEN